MKNIPFKLNHKGMLIDVLLRWNPASLNRFGYGGTTMSGLFLVFLLIHAYHVEQTLKASHLFPDNKKNKIILVLLKISSFLN